MHMWCDRSFRLLLQSIWFNKLETKCSVALEKYTSFLFIALRMQQCYNLIVHIMEKEMNKRNNKKKTDNRTKRMSILFLCSSYWREEQYPKYTFVYFTTQCFLFFWCLLFNILCLMFHTTKPNWNENIRCVCIFMGIVWKSIIGIACEVWLRAVTGWVIVSEQKTDWNSAQFATTN